MGERSEILTMPLQGYVVEVMKNEGRCAAKLLVRPGILTMNEMPEARLGDIVELEARIFLKRVEPEGRPADTDSKEEVSNT